jgi:hypothetical protein
LAPHSSFDTRHSSLQSPASVLLLTAEDDLADTIRPRLEALGADCDKILAIWSVPGEHSGEAPRAFTLSRDLERLKTLLDAIPNCRLLIIDPISAYLGNTSENANADIQSLLTALATIARERNLAVLVVSHLRKKEGAAVYRTMGSLAFTAAARAVWTIRKDPEDANKRLLLPVKSNLTTAATGLAFTIETTGDSVPTVRWSPDPISVTPELFANTDARPNGRPDEEREFAIAWLRERLTQGALPTRGINEASQAQGISRRTLHRAFQSLGGQAVRKGPFPFGEWWWKLPHVDCQNPDAEFWQSTTFPDDFIDPLQSSPAPLPPFSGGARSAPSPTNTQQDDTVSLNTVKAVIDDLLNNLNNHDATPPPKFSGGTCSANSPPPPIHDGVVASATSSTRQPTACHLKPSRPIILPCPPTPASTSTTPPPVGRSPKPSTEPSTATSAKSARPTAAAATAKPANRTASSNAPARASPA